MILMEKERVFVANFKSPLGIMGQVLPQWVDYFVKQRELLSNNFNKIIVAPPFPYLREMKAAMKDKNLPIALAAQDVSSHEPGSYTGEISASLLKECGVDYVIIGHSETRNENCLTPLKIREKIEQAQKHNIIPIVCVRNVEEAMASISPDFEGIIAYEPECAIGSGKPISPKMAEKVCKKIKKSYPNAKILYGGSVNRENVTVYIGKPNINGVLVGRHSVDPEFFGKILRKISQ